MDQLLELWYWSCSYDKKAGRYTDSSRSRCLVIPRLSSATLSLALDWAARANPRPRRSWKPAADVKSFDLQSRTGETVWKYWRCVEEQHGSEVDDKLINPPAANTAIATSNVHKGALTCSMSCNWIEAMVKFFQVRKSEHSIQNARPQSNLMQHWRAETEAELQAKGEWGRNQWSWFWMGGSGLHQSEIPASWMMTSKMPFPLDHLAGAPTLSFTAWGKLR